MDETVDSSVSTEENRREKKEEKKEKRMNLVFISTTILTNSCGDRKVPPAD